MKASKTKKVTETQPTVDRIAKNEDSSAYLAIKSFLEKNNTDLDPSTRHYFDRFSIGTGTKVREIDNTIIATNYLGKWVDLYISSDGKCSMGICISGGF